MRTLIEVVALSWLVWFASVSRQHGYQAAWTRAEAYYAGTVDARVNERVAGFRRVQQIREKAAYRKGWDKCVDALALPESQY